jgi:hypothetical protein
MHVAGHVRLLEERVDIPSSNKPRLTRHLQDQYHAAADSNASGGNLQNE